jgi:hypothetical protein
LGIRVLCEHGHLHYFSAVARNFIEVTTDKAALATAVPKLLTVTPKLRQLLLATPFLDRLCCYLCFSCQLLGAVLLLTRMQPRRHIAD